MINAPWPDCPNCLGTKLITKSGNPEKLWPHRQHKIWMCLQCGYERPIHVSLRGSKEGE